MDDVIYLALLRGVNVGGKNKVEMSRLKTTFETAGLSHVRTYINSGNVIFADDNKSASNLALLVEKAIATEFGFPIEVLLRDIRALSSVARAVPPSWKDDSTMRCYVMFLWEHVDRPSVTQRLTIKDDIDDVIYVPGAIIWRVDRTDLNRSGMMKLTRDELYRSMTIRSCNTVRKLADLMRQADQDEDEGR